MVDRPASYERRRQGSYTGPDLGGPKPIGRLRSRLLTLRPECSGNTRM
jgi:hypothetical protein